MALNNPYAEILVESFLPAKKSGLHGPVHIRPVAGQPQSKHLMVECSKSLITDYKVGTIFKIRAKLTDRDGGTKFLYSSYRWPFTVVSKKAAAAFLKKPRMRQ